MNTTQSSRLRALGLIPAVLTLGLIAALALSAFVFPRAKANAAVPLVTQSDHHATSAAVPRTKAQAALHDQMRKLWEDHVTWTRLAIVTFADDSPSFPATASRLLQNQDDIGAAIKPYYGDSAGDRLTALLRDHITIAVEVLQAAKSGDTAAFAEANTRWYANGNDIADFLAAANPKSWPQDAMRAGMAGHLDQTLAEAAHELGGDYAASIADYEEVHSHILGMADLLSEGIMRQVPGKVG